MSKKCKILLCVIGIFLVISILIGISYAYYIFSVSQSGSNVVRTDCFEITFEDGNAINLTNTIPLTDKDARKLNPYTFTISNVCNYDIDYDVNLETLNGSTIDLSAVKVKINQFAPFNLGDIENNDNSSIINNNAISSKNIKSGSLKGNTSKSFDLRLYIDENSTVEQSADKEFYSKVVVVSRLKRVEVGAKLMDGQYINEKIYELSENNGNVEKVLFSQEAPSNDTYVVVSTADSKSDVLMWFENGIIYIYSDSPRIFLNEDSSNMFSSLYNLNEIDVSRFDSSIVTDMSGMFYGLNHLETLALSNFDTSNVTDMSSMFNEDQGLINLNISSFDTSNVENMSHMFSYLCSIERLDLSNFDTSKVTDMSWMFDKGDNDTNLIYLDLSSFDTSNVIDMSNMFSHLWVLQSLDLSNFDTSKVENMSSMFDDLGSLTYLDISNFNTSNVTNMSYMFSNLWALQSLDLSNFDTSKVENMTSMFSDMHELKSINLSSFNTLNVNYMSQMFSGDTKLEELDLSNFDTSNVTGMSGMFRNMVKLTSLNITSFNTSKVTGMASMFEGASTLKVLDLSSFNTSSLSNINNMFKGMTSVETIYVSNEWDTERISVDYFNSVFAECDNLVGGAGTTKSSVSYIYTKLARVDDPDNGKPGLFTLKTT